ncbi:MAG: TVP38/TMEM64 family protein [Candidatus Pacebacteria bacterium]|nr:TVP38/TMEM64 family protein [Candidatus Paceibacterota bacterium]
MNQRIGRYTGGLLIGVLFVFSAYATQVYTAELEAALHGHGMWGPALYVLLAALSVILAPLNTLFLLPVAGMLWGPFVAAMLSIGGWTLGSVGAYAIAQRYGKPLVGRFVDLGKVERVAESIPTQHVFWWVVAMRMVVSVDVLSYVLGLTLSMRYGTYMLATLIGVTPFAFVFAYASTLPLPYMLLATGCAVFATALGAYALVRHPR